MRRTTATAGGWSGRLPGWALAAALAATGVPAQRGDGTPDRATPDRAPPAAARVWIGSVGRDVLGGIYRCELDLRTGRLGEPGLAVESVNATFLARHPTRDRLYATSLHRDTRPDSTIDAFDIAPGGVLHLRNYRSVQARGACFVEVDPSGRCVLVANYGSGSVSALAIDDAGGLGAIGSVREHTGASVDESRQERPHAHAIRCSADGAFAYACDLGTDEVWIYRLDAARAELTPAGRAALPPGAGPRHLRLSADGQRVFVVCELDLTVATFDRDAATGALANRRIAQLWPEDRTKAQVAASEVALHPTGRWLYGAVRDLDDLDRDTLTVFAVDADGGLQRVAVEPATVRVPRHFAIDPTGRWLLAAGQRSNDVAVFAVDAATGALSPTGQRVDVPLPMCVLIEIEAP